MIKNNTLVECAMTRRSINKLPMLFTLSTTGLLCYLVPSLWMFIFVGTIVNTLFLLSNVLKAKTEILSKSESPNIVANEIVGFEDQSVKAKGSSENYKLFQSILFSTMTALSIGMALFVSVWFFKDYRNTVLQ
mgnify:CR=1 FL=1